MVASPERTHETMPEKRLNDLLKELTESLEALGDVTPEDRALLETLATDIRRRLDPAGAEEAPLTERLNEAIDQFEQSHPRIAYTLRGVMDALAKMGI